MAHEVSEGTAQENPSVLSGTRPTRRRFDAVGVLAAVVVAVAVAVRLVFLRNQSYWGDEIFSVKQASDSLGRVFEVGRTEIHTPLYALVLWAWERIGGSTTLWTHALSGLFGLGAVVVSWTGLRGAGLSERARRLAVALTAATGFGIVYSQESRPYALALLGATGVTAATVRELAILRGVVPCRTPGWRRALVWTAWALLTAAAHLLGAVLVGVLALTLALVAARARRTRDALVVLGLGALAFVPQLAWIVTGMGRSGFAAGTDWIRAPGAGDVWVLLTTVFTAGGLEPRSDGFAWTAPAGVVLVVVLLVVAGVLRLRHAGHEQESPDARSGAQAAPDPQAGAAARDVRLGLAMLAVAAVCLTAVFLLSQVVHIWTLRNMIVVVPALTWGLAWVVTGLPQRERERRALAVVVLVATLVSLGAAANDLRHPYKTDWRGLVRYLARERAAHPSATFSLFGTDPLNVAVAADRGPEPDRYLRRIDSRIDRHPRTEEAIAGLRRVSGPQVVFYYTGVAHPQLEEIYRAISARLADPSCTRVPVYGLVVVSCP